MHWQTPLGPPRWTDGRARRLLLSFALAAVLVTAVLSVLRMPAIPDISPLVELVVRIVRPDPPQEAQDEEVEPPADPLEQERVPEESPEALTEPVDAAVDDEEPPAETVEDPTDAAAVPNDWDAVSDDTIEAYLDAAERPPSMTPLQDEMRRQFRGRYQPPTHPGPKPIWENAEIDQLGRTVLRSGDCYKVLSDPNVGSQAQHEVFGQYMAICTWQKRLPKELPWVDDIRQRYEYLRDPDGYLKGEEEE